MKGIDRACLFDLSRQAGSDTAGSTMLRI